MTQVAAFPCPQGASECAGHIATQFSFTPTFPIEVGTTITMSVNCPDADTVLYEYAYQQNGPYLPAGGNTLTVTQTLCDQLQTQGDGEVLWLRARCLKADCPDAVDALPAGVICDNQTPLAVISPSGANVNEGDPYSFQAFCIGGDLPTTLVFEYSDDGGNTWFNAPNPATGTATAAIDGRQYRATCTDADGDVATSVAQLNVSSNAAASITFEQSGRLMLLNKPAEFVGTCADGSLGVFERSSDGGATWAFAGNGPTLAIPADASTDGTQWRYCCGATCSTIETIELNPTINPWDMDAAQYSLHQFDSVNDLNNSPGAHPVYGATTLNSVSDPTNNPDNGPQPQQAQFRFQAAPTHYLKDDPVVFPNQHGVSHLHMFYGNTCADADSVVGDGTVHDLFETGASTVQGGKGANPSAYWLPALLDGPLGGPNNPRNIIKPSVITVYYKSKMWAQAQQIPAGLALIGGNTPGNPPMVHGFQIQNAGGGTFLERATWGFYNPAAGIVVEKQPTIPTSNPNGWQYIRCVIGFPQCIAVDGAGNPILDSPDHLAHSHILEDNQGFSRDEQPCPASHPYRIPHLEILVDFPWPSNGNTTGWRLSSDMGADTAAVVANPGGSLHADVLFAWNPLVNDAWMDGCYQPNDPRNCSLGNTGTNNNLLRNLDRIQNTPTINNQQHTGNPYCPDPYDV